VWPASTSEIRAGSRGPGRWPRCPGTRASARRGRPGL
jgi:hypothetical protein